MAQDNSNPLNLSPARFSEPKRNSALSSLFLLILITALIPLGVYLVGQRTDLIPQAATPIPPVGETILKLNYSQNTINVGEEFIVQVLIKSDLQPANLISTKINFPKDNLSVKSINLNPGQKEDTGYFLKKWLDYSFDNNSGQINLLASIPPPGLLTKAGQDKYLLSEITFQPILPGDSKIELAAQSSAVYSFQENLNILKTASPPLELQINGESIQNQTESTPSAQVLELTSPQGGEAYLYNSHIPVIWQSKVDDIIQISLLRNDQLQGYIATAEAKVGRYDLIPSQVIAQSLLNPLHSFKLRISSQNSPAQSSQSKGPFEILNLPSLPSLATSAASLNRITADFKKDGQLNLSDLSVLISNQGADDKKYDLNHDSFINDIDAWLLYKLISPD